MPNLKLYPFSFKGQAAPYEANLIWIEHFSFSFATDDVAPKCKYALERLYTTVHFKSYFDKFFYGFLHFWSYSDSFGNISC